MKPTQEQVIAWAREAGFATSWTEAAGEALECFATLAYEAGRKERTMTDRELMQMALDAIEGFYPSLTELHNAHTKTAEALRARLAQPERKWQGLTDDEILEEYRQSYGDDGNLTDVYFARAIEAKLKEKNG